MGKQENPIGMTWHADLCHLAPNLLYNILLAHRSHEVESSGFESDLSHMDWGQENSESTVKPPTPNVGEQILETSISGRDRQPKDVRTQNACALLTYTIWW